MELVSRTDIQEYAKRNTSQRMPIEGKYVEAYCDSMLNSTEVTKVYSDILNKVRNENSFLCFNSFWTDAPILNAEPFKSILAYAMLKKDFFLFQLISWNMFTGTVEEYYGEDLYSDIVLDTDESPLHYTDQNSFTDMSAGKLLIGFKNVYSPETLDDGSGTQYQSEAEYDRMLNFFKMFITMVKPARVNVLVFSIPYCFLTGDEFELLTLNVVPESEDPYFTSPFKNMDAMRALKKMSSSILFETYGSVSSVDPETGAEYPVEYSREFEETADFVTYLYDVRVQKTGDDVWHHVRINVGETSEVIFVDASDYQLDKEYYQGYKPIMLRLNDDDPFGPVLAFEVPESGECEVAALLYTRFLRGE